MLCQNCGHEIGQSENYYRAGNNRTVFCSKDCCYEAFEGFYSRKEVDRTMEEYTHITKEDQEMNKEELQSQEFLQGLAHELDSALGDVGLNLNTLKAIDAEMGRIHEGIENTDMGDITKMAMYFRDISHKLSMITDLLHYVVLDFDGNHDRCELVKSTFFDVAHDKDE